MDAEFKPGMAVPSYSGAEAAVQKIPDNKQQIYFVAVYREKQGMVAIIFLVFAGVLGVMDEKREIFGIEVGVTGPEQGDWLRF